MLVGFGSTIGYTIAVGDLGKVAMPIDREGNFCGKPAGYEWNLGQKERFFFKNFAFYYHFYHYNITNATFRKYFLKETLSILYVKIFI